MSIDVIRRPNDAAEVTSRLFRLQMYGWCVWALTTMSTAGSSRLTTSSRSGPVKFSHLFTSMNPRENGAFWSPPSCSSRTIVLTFRCFSRGTSALIVSASSRKFSPATPVGVTISGVPCSVSPTKAIFSPSDVLTIRYCGSSGLFVSVSVTFAARYWKTEPANGVPSWQPSPGWQPSGRAGA